MKPLMASALGRIALSDCCALVAAGCVIYGIQLLDPAWAWIAGGVVFGCVSVELGKRELARQKDQ